MNIDCDPNSPLNDSFFKNMGVQTPRQKYEVKMERRKQLMDSETSKLNTQQLKIYIYKTLSYILAPFTLFISLLITRPWIEKKQQEVDELFANRKWVEKDMPIEEYKEIQNKRADLKATFTESADLEKSAKPHKVCIGLNEAGHKTTILEEVKTVRMWCDKAQANRWSLSFLNESAQQDYQNSVIESIQLQEEIAPSGGYNC